MSIPHLKYNENFKEIDKRNIVLKVSKLYANNIISMILKRYNCVVITNLHTFYVQKYSVYSLNYGAFIYYKDDFLGQIYINKQLPYKWENILRKIYPRDVIYYINSNDFEKFKLKSIDYLTFRNIKHKNQVLKNFQMSLKKEEKIEFVEDNSIDDEELIS